MKPVNLTDFTVELNSHVEDLFERFKYGFNKWLIKEYDLPIEALQLIEGDFCDMMNDLCRQNINLIGKFSERMFVLLKPYLEVENETIPKEI
jgi:hypothetical protein